MTTEQDIVLIHLEDQPLSFARIEKIIPDHKKDWYHVTLLMLQVPLQSVTWILRDAYIEGEEYTMGGKKMRLEKVVCPATDSEFDDEPMDGDEPIDEPTPETSKNATVISFADLKKNNE